MIFYLGVLTILIVLLLLLSAVWPPDSPWSPWWKTYKKTGKAAIKLANISSKDTVYELGSGDGEFLILVGKTVGAKCVGIEIDPLRHLIASTRVKRMGLSAKITLKKKSFFDEDISGASVVYVYLIPRVLKKLTPKFKRELKKGTRVVSFVYPIKNLKLVKEDKKNRLFLYKIENTTLHV